MSAPRNASSARSRPPGNATRAANNENATEMHLRIRRVAMRAVVVVVVATVTEVIPAWEG